MMLNQRVRYVMIRRGHDLFLRGCASSSTNDTKILGKIHRLPFLPKYFTYKDGTKLKVDVLRRDRVKLLYHMIERRFDQKHNIGIIREVMPTEGAFTQLLQNSDLAAEISDVTDCANTKVAGVLQVQPQSSCRSAAPIVHGGYIILDHQYQGLGSGKDLLFLMCALGMAAGYRGKVTLAAMEYAPPVRINKCAGAVMTGVIPRSMLLPGYGLIDDAVLHTDYTLVTPGLPQAKLSEEDVIQRAIQFEIPNKRFANKFLLHIDEAVTSYARLRTSAEKGEDQAYRMLTFAAAIGDGFGVDEFPQQNIFQRKFLHNRSLLLLTSKSGETIGVTVVGPCHLCRSSDPLVAVLYIYITPEYRRKGLGGAVMKCVIRHLVKKGYSGLLCDVLITPGFPHSFLRRQGFYQVGTIPCSAYLHERGWADSALYFRDFNTPLKGSWVEGDTAYLTNSNLW